VVSAGIACFGPTWARLRAARRGLGGFICTVFALSRSLTTFTNGHLEVVQHCVPCCDSLIALLASIPEKGRVSTKSWLVGDEYGLYATPIAKEGRVRPEDATSREI